MNAYAAIWITAWRDSLANRRALWTQVAVMMANDLVWIVFWTMFFDRVGTMRGWDIDRVILLQAALTSSGGIALGLFANCRHVGRIIRSGALDATLAAPTRPLPHLLVARIETIALGDILFGLALFAIRGHPTPARVGVFAYGVTCATVVFTGFLTLAGASTFFTGRNDSADLGFHSILLFGSYPVDIFRGSASLVLHLAVPAAFVATVPAKLIDDFDLLRAATLALAALVTAGIAALTFHAGLRRYTSGATWTQR